MLVMNSRWLLLRVQRTHDLGSDPQIPRSFEEVPLHFSILPSSPFLLFITFPTVLFSLIILYSRVELRERRHSVNGRRVSQHRTRETGTVVLVRDTGEDKFSRPRTHLLSPTSPRTHLLSPTSLTYSKHWRTT